MAAIDKMYISSFSDFDEFRRWLFAFYPKMAMSLFNPFTSYSEFTNNQKRLYDNYKKNLLHSYNHMCTKFNDLKCTDLENFVPTSTSKLRSLIKPEYSGLFWIIDDMQHTIDMLIELKNLSEEDYIEKYCSIAIAAFSFKDDKRLLWRCPCECVRKYLLEHCGYKTKWYHKIFFKYL